MINLSIKLSHSEMKDFTEAVTVIYKYCNDSLKANDYYHYYNIQSLWKRLFDKSFRGFKKSNSIHINVNEFESMKQVMYKVEDLHYDYYSSPHGIILQKIVGILDKQRHSIIDFRKSSLMVK